MELKKVRKLVLELENELQRLQRGDEARTSCELEFEALFEKREHEFMNYAEDGAALLEAEERNAELQEEIEDVRHLLEVNSNGSRTLLSNVRRTLMVAAAGRLPHSKRKSA
jgi:hypothetical protein